MSTTTSLGGAVLAGGQSRRMGTDKALLEVDGTTLVQRAVDALEAAAAEPVVVVGGAAPAIETLGLRAVPDLWPGEGPLGGIITALEAVPRDVVMILSCDLTDASAIAVRSVAGARGDADLSVPVVEGRAQWLHAAWHRRSLPVLRAAFESGIRAPRFAVEGLTVARLLDGDPCWFRDADSPADLGSRDEERSRLGSIARMDIPEIDVDELERHLGAGASLVDVREDDEFATAHIEGASLIPLGTIPDSLQEFSTSRPVYVICAKGGRSARAVEFLRAEGIDATNVAGGMTAWLTAGKPSRTGHDG